MFLLDLLVGISDLHTSWDSRYMYYSMTQGPLFCLKPLIQLEKGLPT